MSRPVDAGLTGTLYRARVRRTFTVEGRGFVVRHEAFGPYARKQDARAAIRREGNAAWGRRVYADYVETWTIERLTGEWQEVPE